MILDALARQYRTCTGKAQCRKRGRRGGLPRSCAAKRPRLTRRQQALGGARSLQLWDRPPATKRATAGGGAVDNTSLGHSLLGWGRGEPRRAVVGPRSHSQTSEGRQFAAVGEVWARVARGAGRQERRRGCKGAPQSQVGGSAPIPRRAPRVQEMKFRRERERERERVSLS